MNQNLLIVDDEREILLWLEEMFKSEFDIEVGVYTAGSVMDALNLLDRIRFDVVLTDIRMPGLDGIALFERIKENWPRCKTVFLTGYRSFDDIYRIINNKDVRYILKSEEDEVIIEAVRESLQLVIQEEELERLQKEQEIQLAKGKYWMRRELMDQICAGLLPDNIKARVDVLDIPLDVDKKVLIFLLRIDHHWQEEQIEERFIHEERLVQILHKNAPVKLRIYVHIMKKQQELLFVQPEDWEEDWDKILALSCGMIEYAQAMFKKIYNSTFSAVVHTEAVVFDEIPSVLRRLNACMIRHMGGAQEMIMKESSLQIKVDEDREKSITSRIPHLQYLLELRKRQEYFELLGECLKVMIARESRYDTQALEIYYSISILLLQFINDNHLNKQLAFKIGIYKLTRVEAHPNWMEAAHYLTEVSDAIFKLLDSNENTLTQRALTRVVAYIEDNLDEDLSLNVLAEVGGYNASYLSRLFKQVQRESISEFILHKRMELAKELLAHTNEKIQDIAVKTGYLSAHSFSRAFRNEIGISPMEYREMKNKEKM